MCGIIGFNWNDLLRVKKLAALVNHRGPDQEGAYTDKNVSLGHKRLSIIDLSEKGKQPMSSSDQTIWITYNGEIFNFQEIKKELISKGYKFKSKTDTEVIIEGYKEYGTKILDKLNGQFAFCIYDKKKEQLFLARDRIGINPLYYYFDGNKFIFGSELKIIMGAGIKKEINRFALNYYLMYGHTPRKQSILENTYKLEPGHFMIFDLKNKKIKKYTKYWGIHLTDEIKDEKLAKKIILEKLDESVKKRLIADVPVGAFLSGGLDSSAVVALMSKYTKNLNTFSIKFDYQDFDESKYAEIVSKKFETKHHVIKFSAKDVKELLPKLVYHYDEPFGDPSMIPTYLVSKVAKQHVTVSLSGDGGDELFGGYNSYKHFRLLNFQKYYPAFINKILYKLFKPIKNHFFVKPRAFWELGTLPKKHKFARLMSYLSMDEFKQITGEDPIKYYEAYGGAYFRKNYLDNAQTIDIHTYLPDNNQTKVDRSSMANSLETRPPILDHELIEKATKFHHSLRLKGRNGKYIFKKALEGILPKKVLYRKKQGFGVPLKYYFRNELKDMVYEYVINFTEHNLFDSSFIKKIIAKKKWGRDYSRIIWSILIFNLWWQKWMKN